VLPLRDDVPSRTRPVVAWLLILANAAVFWHELTLGRRLVPFIETWGLVPARYTLGHMARGMTWAQYLGPFASSMFLHGGWLHIISNMWVLYIFGDNVEDRLGHGRFLLFYLLCGLAAGITQIWAAPRSVLPTVGASGAIAGVMGAYFILFPTARVLTLVPIIIFFKLIELPASIFLGLWILTQVFATKGGAGGIAWWAHIGGFVAGVVLLGPFLPRARGSRR
jgi:membrane associated rhomboid family serine protease